VKIINLRHEIRFSNFTFLWFRKQKLDFGLWATYKLIAENQCNYKLKQFVAFCKFNKLVSFNQKYWTREFSKPVKLNLSLSRPKLAKQFLIICELIWSFKASNCIKMSLRELLKKLFFDHLETSTIGGLVYLTHEKLSKSSKAFWSFVVLAGIFTSLGWSISFYQNWQTNPTITTIVSPGN